MTREDVAVDDGPSRAEAERLGGCDEIDAGGHTLSVREVVEHRECPPVPQRT